MLFSTPLHLSSQNVPADIFVEPISRLVDVMPLLIIQHAITMPQQASLCVQCVFVMDMILEKIVVKAVLLLAPEAQLKVCILGLRESILSLQNRFSLCCRFVCYAMFLERSIESFNKIGEIC
jgi:hypothetical protein